MGKFYLYLFLFITSAVFSQEDAWVYFNAKPNSQSYFGTPLQMLSQRALDRRTNQNIALDLKDIPIELSYINQIRAVVGISVLAKSKWLNALHVRGNQSAINSLKSFSFVDKIDFANKSLNLSGKTKQAAKINVANKKRDAKVVYPYGFSSNQIQMLNGHLLHQQNYTGSGKIIAVLDAGFPGVNTIQPFQRLRDNNQILGGYDYVSRNANFYAGDSHGTSVLSTMGGYKENALVGTAPDASYYLFITEDTASENPVEESLWVEAAEKADSLGVDIINTSLGYFDYDDTAYSHAYSEMDGETAFMSRGAEIAYSRGMIIVTSAGNSGGSADPYIAVPADAVSVIAVGAVNSTETITSFSSIGPSYDGRVKPDVMAQGQATIMSDEFGNIVTGNGTSFSCPVTAGMIACLWQAFPSKTNQEIRQLVLQCSDRFLNPTSQYGYGIPDFNLALSNGLPLDSFSKAFFVVYPNPSSDLVLVSLTEENSEGTVTLYAVSGEKILEEKISTKSPTFSIKSLSRGMYIYNIESNGFCKSGKIMKQ